MLFYLLTLILVVVQKESFSLRPESQNINKTNNKSCKNIKCPPVEDPVCVKIKKNNEKHKGTYILAINKCEIQYATCHQEIDAVIVPMKHCQHNEVNNKDTNLKRVKRDNDGEADMTDENVVSNNEDVEEGNASNESNGNDNEEDKKESPNVDDEKEDEDEDPNKNKQQNSDEKRLYEYIPDLNLGPDYDIKEKDVDYDQYGNDCPSVCPVREMMVCAECGHKIYKTFLSPCHLRQFNCKYPDEKLKLVKREPCMQSAPFLTNLNEAKGRVSEPTDEDRVLKFINCRDTGKLGDQDCKFDDKL